LETAEEHLCKMGREEQIEEREVLDSIFPEEIQGMWLRKQLSKSPLFKKSPHPDLLNPNSNFE